MPHYFDVVNSVNVRLAESPKNNDIKVFRSSYLHDLAKILLVGSFLALTFINENVTDFPPLPFAEIPAAAYLRPQTDTIFIIFEWKKGVDGCSHLFAIK
jgi:hypothetical protein